MALQVSTSFCVSPYTKFGVNTSNLCWDLIFCLVASPPILIENQKSISQLLWGFVWKSSVPMLMKIGQICGLWRIKGCVELGSKGQGAWKFRRRKIEERTCDVYFLKWWRDEGVMRDKSKRVQRRLIHRLGEERVWHRTHEGKKRIERVSEWARDKEMRGRDTIW